MNVQLTQDWQGRPAGESLALDDASGDTLVARGLAVPIPDPSGALAAKALEQATSKLSAGLESAVNLTLKGMTGGTSQFSSTTLTATVLVNTAPVPS